MKHLKPMPCFHLQGYVSGSAAYTTKKNTLVLRLRLHQLIRQDMRREVTNLQRNIIKDPVNRARHVVRHGKMNREQMAVDTNEIRRDRTGDMLLARRIQHRPHPIIHDTRVPPGRGRRPRASLAGKPERAGQVTPAAGAGAVTPRYIDDLAAVVVAGLGLAH